MNMKIRKTRFESIVDLPQIKLMKVIYTIKRWWSSLLTFRGMSIEWSDEHENISGLIRANLGYNSTHIDLIVVQSDQRFAPRSAVEPEIHRAEKTIHRPDRWNTLSSTISNHDSSNGKSLYHIGSDCVCSDRLEWYVNDVSWRFSE
jgi:hypothetical protein